MLWILTPREAANSRNKESGLDFTSKRSNS